MLTLNEYKNYLINYCRYEIDNTTSKRMDRSYELDRKYNDLFLQKIIDDTYIFSNKILESETRKDNYYHFELEEDCREFITLDLTGGGLQDELFYIEDKYISKYILKYIFGNQLMVEFREELNEMATEDEDIYSFDFNYYLYIQGFNNKLNNIYNIDDINEIIKHIKENGNSVKNISDGNHTFNEYIDMRNNLFIGLCNAYPDLAWKSKRHYDEENDPMYNDDFIAGINTPNGEISFHLKMNYWDELNVIELDKAPEYDGYTEEDVKIRIKSLKRDNYE